jgi:hypothetical protein
MYLGLPLVAYFWPCVSSSVVLNIRNIIGAEMEQPVCHRACDGVDATTAMNSLWAYHKLVTAIHHFLHLILNRNFSLYKHGLHTWDV